MQSGKELKQKLILRKRNTISAGVVREVLLMTSVWQFLNEAGNLVENPTPHVNSSLNTVYFCSIPIKVKMSF